MSSGAQDHTRVHGYTPSCPFCRDNAPSYYKACIGCVNRRQYALLAWLKTDAGRPMPKPGIDKPSSQ